jgi:hypothetical protein
MRPAASTGHRGPRLVRYFAALTDKQVTRCPKRDSHE